MNRKIWGSCSLAGALLAVPTGGWSQQPSMRARELFYSPPPGAEAVVEKKSADTPAKTTPPARTTPKKSEPVQAKKSAPAATVPAAAAPVVESAQQPKPARAEVVNAARNAVPLALRYSVLKQEGGAFREVDPENTFRSGDRIRLTVRANDDAFLYVVMRGSSGTWSLLFPSKEYAGGDNHLKKGKDYTIPAGGRGQFVFDERAGEERLFLVLSRQPEADLDQLIYNLDQRRGVDESRQGLMLAESRPMTDGVIDKLRSELRSRDLVFEKVDETSTSAPPSAPAKEMAIYVANPKATPEARLVADILLKHQ
jgi:hypothetical protein